MSRSVCRAAKHTCVVVQNAEIAHSLPSERMQDGCRAGVWCTYLLTYSFISFAGMEPFPRQVQGPCGRRGKTGSFSRGVRQGLRYHICLPHHTRGFIRRGVRRRYYVLFQYNSTETVHTLSNTHTHTHTHKHTQIILHSIYSAVLNATVLSEK